MHYRPIGNTQASVVGFGAWAIGGWMWGGADEQDAVDAIHAAIDGGMNLIDTAPIYGFGRSEEIVGKAIHDRRVQVFLATKCGLRWDTDQGEHHFNATDQRIDPTGEIAVHKYLHPDSIEQELDASLKRLQTDHIDLYQTHWQESTTPIEDTMAKLEHLRNKGKIRAIGVSNAAPEQMDQYRHVGRIAADQEKYSMLDRELEDTNLPYCAEHDIAFLAYSPIAQGLLTGSVTPEREFEEGDQRKHKERFSVENRKRVMALLDEIRPVAVEHGITLGQLAIAWTVHQPGCTHALVGARNRDQVRENAGAGDVDLTPEQVGQINQAIEKHTAELV